MTENNQEFQFLHEVAKQISERSKQTSEISIEEVFDMFQDTFKKLTTAKVVEIPLFVPVVLEQEDDDFYTAHSFAYSRIVKGVGRTEEEAIERFKEEVERYHRSCIEVDRKTRIEKIISRIFPKF